MRKEIPFFGNTRDNTHCFQASMRMILKHFLPKKNFTWKELERMSAKKPGKWTWPTRMLLSLEEMGFDVVMFDAFDIDSFIERGGDFLIEAWGEEMGNAQIKNSDIAQERRLYKRLKDRVAIERRAPMIRDLRRFLAKGYLIECNVNARKLDAKPGYSGHSILVYAVDKAHVHLHDPGLPHRPHHRVTRSRFIKAWKYPRSGSQTMVAVRLGAAEKDREARSPSVGHHRRPS